MVSSQSTAEPLSLGQRNGVEVGNAAERAVLLRFVESFFIHIQIDTYKKKHSIKKSL